MKESRWKEKQKPRKVLYEDVGYDYYRGENVWACKCPSCDLEIITFYDSDVSESESDNPEQMFHDCLIHHAHMGLNNFCNRCGQALDWGIYKAKKKRVIK